MGQLERYGLYVLCLVIFLILGVAIWGGDPPAARNGGENLSAQLSQAAVPVTSDPLAAALPANPSINDLLELGPTPAPAAEVAPPPTGEPILPAAASAEPPVERAAPAPAATKARHYVVQKGDMLEEIARVHLGRRDRWREIQALNPGVEEKNLREGQRLVLPSRDGAADTESRAWFLYTVKKNDNPSKISKELYGTQNYANRILALNPGLDPKKLRPGSEIRVPIRR